MEVTKEERELVVLLRSVPADSAGYLDLIHAESLRSLNSILRTVKTKSISDVLILLFASSQMEVLLGSLSKATRSDCSLDLSIFQKEFFLSCQGELDFVSSKIVARRKVRSVALFIHFMLYRDGAKAVTQTNAVVSKTKRIEELVLAKSIDSYFTDETLLSLLQKHREGADLSNVNVEPYFTKARKEKENLSAFMEVILTLTTLVIGQLEKNMILDTACWILGYSHGDLFSGRPGWLAFLFEESFHWLTGIEKQSRIKRRKISEVNADSLSSSLSSLATSSHWNVVSPVRSSQQSSISTDASASTQDEHIDFVTSQSVVNVVEEVNGQEDIFSLLDRVEESTRKRSRRDYEDDGKEEEQEHFIGESSDCDCSVERTKNTEYVKEKGNQSGQCNGAVISEHADSTVIVPDASQPAPDSRAGASGNEHQDQLETQGEVAVDTGAVLNIIDLTGDDCDSNAMLPADATEKSVIATLAPIGTVRADNDFNITKIELEFSRNFFLLSPRHAAKFMYSQCIKLLNHQKHLSADQLCVAKREVYDTVRKHIQDIRDTQGNITDQSVAVLNSVLWDMYLKLCIVHAPHQRQLYN